MAKNPSNLFKPKGTSVWWLKKNRPTKIGGGRIRLSTGEREVRKAIAKRDIMLGELAEDWAKKEAELNGQLYLSRDDLKKMVMQVLPKRWDFFNTAHHKMLKPPIRKLHEEMRHVEKDVSDAIDQHLADEGLQLSLNDLEFLQEMTVKYHSGLVQADINDLLGGPVNKPELVENQVTKESVDNGRDINEGKEGRLSLIEATELVKTSKEWKNKSPSSQKGYEQTFKILLRIFPPNRTVGSLRSSDFQRIGDIFEGLPLRVMRDNTFDIEKAVEECLPENRIAIATHDRHVTALHLLFNWLEGNGYIDVNYAKLKLHGQKKRGSDEDTRYDQLPLSDDDCKAYFQYIYGTGKLDMMFWIPAMGMLSGARVNEICQLRPTDIRKIDGVWTFQVLKDKNAKMSVKKKGSERKVPIHSALIKAGFLDFLDENTDNDNGRIFADLKWHEEERWSRIFKKRFDYRLGKLGIKPAFPERKSFHGFRYRMTDLLVDEEKQIELGLIDGILGWTTQEREALKKRMSTHYSGRVKKDIPIRELQSALEKVEAPDWFKVLFQGKG